MTTETARLRPVLTIDPAVQFGRVCVESTRVTAENVAERVAAGEAMDSVAEDFGITRDDARLACWWYWCSLRDGRSRSEWTRSVLAAWENWATEQVVQHLGGWRPGIECPDPPSVVGE